MSAHTDFGRLGTTRPVPQEICDRPRIQSTRLVIPILSVLFIFILIPSAVNQANAQAVNPGPRITQPIDETALVVLQGNTHPLARPEFDQGPAPASLPMQRMLLVLKRSFEQEAALERLLEQQQDNSSPKYHHWLTPEQFGVEFGPSDQDILTITMWLQSHGFQVTAVSTGRIVIEFSGTAGQVQQAFHTAIHKYLVNGEQHYANATDPQIPAALVPVVAGVGSLHSFRSNPMNDFAGVFRKDSKTGEVLPVSTVPFSEFTPGSNTECGAIGSPCEEIGPYDLATIYNILPLWNASTPIDGTGQTIAIVAETDINPPDWASFWNAFGVTSPKGTLNIIHNGNDPGVLPAEEPEADIDTQWSSAVAKGATIDLVISASTATTQGVDLSAEYIVDNNLAPVMSESYGLCELFLGTAGNAYHNALWQQASAQGITVLVSSGDQGSAVCDNGAHSAQYGLAVNGLGSTPYNVSVGGTDFNDLTTTATYWSSTNNANQANAKGYIPEMTWNDSCTNSELFADIGATTPERACNESIEFLIVVGGSGGASNCTSSTSNSQTSCSGGYAKPPWQSAPGVPADGERDVPDVSLFASNGFNGAFYLVCLSATGSCDLASGTFAGFGGTSISTPVFAGIMALVNQKTGERQGNANYVLYKMAATATNSCDSNTVPSTGTNNCIFYDIPSGSTIAMPCTTGSPNCTTNTVGDPYGVLSGYGTTAGYDLATGLGSVNVFNLVNQWSTYAGQFKATTFSSFTLGPPTSITHGQPIAVAATVVPQTGTGTPTGTVALIANAGSSPGGQQAGQLFTLNNGSLLPGTSTIFLPGGTNYNVTAHYSGDSTFAPSDSSPFAVTVSPEASKTLPAIVISDLASGQVTNTNATSFPFGSAYVLRGNVMNPSGNLCMTSNGIEQYQCPTGTVSFTDTFNGVTSAVDAGTYPMNANGYAEDQTVALFGGQHSLVAAYSGDNSYQPSNNSAAPNVVTVTPQPTNTDKDFGIAGPFIIDTSVTLPFLSTTANPGYYNPAPGGTFTLFDGTKQVPVTVTTFDGFVNPFPNSPYSYADLLGDVQFTVPGPVGPHTFSAVYSGDSNYASSTSPPFTVNVAYPSTTTVTSSAPTATEAQNVTFTATVSSSQTAGPPLTGTVQFQLPSGNLGNPVAVSNGQAQLTTTSLPIGILLITAIYSGDANYAGSSATLVETVNIIPTSTTVTSTNSTIAQGLSVTFTAQIVPVQTGGPTITGFVSFTANGSGLGNVSIVNKQAQVTTNSLPSGTLSVVANYGGDENYAPSSGTFTETVTLSPTFTVSGNPATVMVSSPGSTGSTVLTITGLNGYSGTIPLSSSLCTGLPLESTCNFSASSVTLNPTGQTSATVTLDVSTTAPVVGSAALGRPKGRGQRAAEGCFLLFSILWIWSWRPSGRRAKWARLSTTIAIPAFVLLLSLCSCGNASGGGGGIANPGTPLGLDQNVVVTFSGAGVMPPPSLNLSIDVE